MAGASGYHCGGSLLLGVGEVLDGLRLFFSDFRAVSALIKASALNPHFSHRLCLFFFRKGWSVACQFLCIVSGMRESLRYLL